MVANKQEIRVLVTGAFGNANFGDDALIHACRNLLSDVIPLNEVAFQATPSSYLQRLFPDLQFVDSISDLPNLEWILYGGGTQFASFENTYDSRGKRLTRALLRVMTNPRSVMKRVMEIRKSRKICYAGVGLGVGPFHNRGSDEYAARSVVRSMQFLSVRDALSHEICKSWQVDRVIRGADLCYLPNLFEHGDTVTATPANPPKNLAVIPRDWNHSLQGDAYRAKLQAGFGELSKLGLNITFVCFSKKGDAKWIEWLKTNNISYIVWNPFDQSIDEFYRKLNEFDIFLTARYHGAVLASLHKKPFIAINIEPKLLQVGKLFQDISRIWDAPFEIQSVAASIEALLESTISEGDIQASTLREQEKLAAEQKRLFSVFVKANIRAT